jgi:hypothetical protein
MLFDDVLIALTLCGLFLSAIYINAEFEEARRRRDRGGSAAAYQARDDSKGRHFIEEYP